MGFLSTADTITITAKLTNSGRKRLLKENNQILSHFILGDSDANYHTSAALPTGLVLGTTGDLGDGIDAGTYKIDDETFYTNYKVKSKLYVNNTTTTKKSVDPNSSSIRDTVENLGEVIVSGVNLTYSIIDKNDNTSDLTNIFKTLSLPILETRKNVFTGTTSAQGGWLDTAFSGFATNRVLIAVINNNSYGEIIDGKTIKCSLPIYTGYTGAGVPTGATQFDFYSTFIKSGQYSRVNLDEFYIDKSIYTEGLFGIGSCVSYLVSDELGRPNDSATLSWSTGYDTFKPFSINNKQMINTINIPSTSTHADTIAGIAYLDKGIMAFTHPDIVNNIATDFSGDTATIIENDNLGLYFYTASTYNTTIDSIDNQLVQNVLCKAERGEFYRSQNETIDVNDIVRISEVAITDVTGAVLAVGKPDRQILKLKNDFVIFDVQIVV